MIINVHLGQTGLNGVNAHLLVEVVHVQELENVNYLMDLKYLMTNVQPVSVSLVCT